MDELHETAKKLFTPYKGILANDASLPSLQKRLKKYGFTSDVETRRIFRNIFYTAPNLEQYISGVILFEEALNQRTTDGVMFPDVLLSKGILPGIKVDQGLSDLTGFENEFTSRGIETLALRLREYKKSKLFFTKWRAAFTVGKDKPSLNAIEENVRLLVDFARKSHEASLLPIVEAEVLMEGNHSLKDCQLATERVLASLFTTIKSQNLPLEQIILKTNMIVAGKENKTAISTDVAIITTMVLRKLVPQNIGGVVFLSGGQKSDEAIDNLGAIMRLGPFPWPLTFSFERVFEEPVLESWSRTRSITESQQILIETAKKARRVIGYDKRV